MSDKNSCHDHATFDLGTFKRNRAAELVDEPCACAIFKINLVPMTPTDRVKCYEDVFDHYMKKLHKVFVTPEKYTDKNGDDVKAELEVKVYRVIQEAFETFFPAFGKGLQSTKKDN